MDRAQIFLGRWQRDDKDEVAGHTVVMNDDVHGYVPTYDGCPPCDGPKIWYWQKKERKLLEPQEVTGTARAVVDLDGAREFLFNQYDDTARPAEVEAWQKWHTQRHAHKIEVTESSNSNGAKKSTEEEADGEMVSGI